MYVKNSDNKAGLILVGWMKTKTKKLKDNLATQQYL